ncbi:hypothetical protein FH972_027080 [Carpinus fangiana]|uniref:Uncharacterized protein n=1 Tax=Carpinus fangiana TaxID=176857 RepID=A0A5N6L6N4_9ROSI|nr:hypothetical protein FH972_027080 [Carpinus fangiana]
MAEERVKRGLFMALLVMLMILMHTNHCGATISIMKDNATSHYHARMEEPAYWMFDSEITRMIVDYNNYVTTGSKNPSKPVVDCSRSPRYDSCLPQKNSIPKGENCDTYNRNC